MIRFVSETGSTSADLAARLVGGEHVPEGEWLVADRQTAGHGRSGREWLDASGNFMGSTVVHSRRGDPPAHTLSLAAGLAVQAAVAPLLHAEGAAFLKWPNDLMIGTGKLAGILLERTGEAVIVGIGVNLISAPRVDGRATVALSQFGKAPARDAFADELARRFELELQRWREFGPTPIVRRWLAAAHPNGTALSVETASGRLDGTFAGLDHEEGSLLLRLADGTLRVIHAGEVRLAGEERD